MLFPYVFLEHRMNKLHQYVEFIFEHVWCKATPTTKYDSEALFADYPELLELIIDLDNSDSKAAENFLARLQKLFEHFQRFSSSQKEQLRSWFCANNNIQLLCEQGDESDPITYQTFKTRFTCENQEAFIADLKEFFMNLYSGDFFKLAAVKKALSTTIDDHNDLFTQLNDQDVCPFCGLSGLLNHYATKREAYDHYFPKSRYPFNSINFYNLVPACPHCNSSYKQAKDPHFDNDDPLKSPRKSFYPFAKEPYVIEITAKITASDWQNVTPNDIALTFGPDSYDAQLATWDDLYGITERYKQTCCSKGGGKYWLMQVVDERKHRATCRRQSPDEFLETLRADCDLNRYAEKNFLKLAFLEGCREAGLFEAESNHNDVPLNNQR